MNYWPDTIHASSSYHSPLGQSHILQYTVTGIGMCPQRAVEWSSSFSRNAGNDGQLFCGFLTCRRDVHPPLRAHVWRLLRWTTPRPDGIRRTLGVHVQKMEAVHTFFNHDTYVSHASTSLHMIKLIHACHFLVSIMRACRCVVMVRNVCAHSYTALGITWCVYMVFFICRFSDIA